GVVADFDPRLFALVLQVLRIIPDYGAIAHFHARAEPRIALEHGVGRHAGAIAHGHLGADNGVRTHRNVVAEIGRGIDQRGAMNHLSTTVAIMIASATT